MSGVRGLVATLTSAREMLGGFPQNHELSSGQQVALADLERELAALQDAQISVATQRALVEFTASIAEGELLSFVLIDCWDAVMDAFESAESHLPRDFSRQALLWEVKNEFFEELREQILEPLAQT